MKRIWLFLSLFLISFTFIHCSRKNRVIATFDNGVVLQKEVDYYISQFPPAQQKEYLGSLERLKSVVKEIAQKKIIYQLAQKEPTIDFTHISNEVLQFRKNYIVHAMTSDLIDASKENVSFSDIRKFSSSMLIRLIWRKTYSGMSEEDIKKERKKAEEIRKKIKRGADFGEMANQYSDDGANFNGGRVGPVNIDDVPAGIREKILSLKEGQVSEIFKTENGWEIVKMEILDKKSRPFKVTFSHILVALKNRTEEKALEKIKKADELIRKGEDFSLVANQFTEDGSNFKNGQLQQFSFGRVYYPIADASFKLDPGELSDVIPTKYGFFIIRMEKLDVPSDNDLEKLEKNERFVERIRRIKENYIHSEKEFELQKRIRDEYNIKEHYSLLTDEKASSNSIVMDVKDTDIKITKGECMPIINISGPTFHSKEIGLQEKIYFTLLFPRLAYDFALKKGYDQKEEVKLKSAEYRLNLVYQEYMDKMTAEEIPVSQQELKDYYNRNSSRYFITRVNKGKVERVKQNFEQAREIVKRHVIQEKKMAFQKDKLDNILGQYHFKLMADRLYVEKNFKYYLSLGNIYYDNKEYKKAEKNFKRALKMEQNSDEASFKLGLTYYKMKKEDKGQERMANLAVRRIPTSLILNELKNSEGKLKLKLIEMLGMKNDPSAEDVLLEIYATSQVMEEKQVACRSLGLLRSEKAVNIFFNDLKEIAGSEGGSDKNQAKILKWYLIEALGYMGNKKVTPYFISLFSSTKDENEKCFLVEALGRLQDKRAVPILEKALKTEIWGIKVLAAEALKKITGKEYKVEEPKKEGV
ncbi:MAG: peptidylprolyl isomerase [Spirochaetes bacterium]|nr:peptidylprolyl isomerase [Spirochaetota bacterium]